jgi:hypothetical protein
LGQTCAHDSAKADQQGQDRADGVGPGYAHGAYVSRRWDKLPRRPRPFHDNSGVIASTNRKHIAASDLNGR